MEPNREVSNASTGSNLPVQESILATPVSSAEQDAKKKGGNGMLIGLILCLVLAIGGIGFGVWAMMDGDSRVREAQSKIDLLSARNDALEDKAFDLTNNSDIVDESEIMEEGSVNDNASEERVEIIHHDVIDDGVVGGSVNPLVVSSDNNEEISIRFQTAIEGGIYLTIISKNGGVESCYVEKRSYFANGGYSRKVEKNCEIVGLNGKIYKIIEFGPSSQDNGSSNIGFVMTDGSVQYFPLLESFKNDNYNIRGSLKINGNVVDLIDVSVRSTGDSYGGYGACYFVLNNGALVRFDDSLL